MVLGTDRLGVADDDEYRVLLALTSYFVNYCSTSPPAQTQSVSSLPLLSTRVSYLHPSRNIKIRERKTSMVRRDAAFVAFRISLLHVYCTLLFVMLPAPHRREYAAGMGQHILCIAGEMVPSHDRAFNILKETTREVSGVYSVETLLALTDYTTILL